MAGTIGGATYGVAKNATIYAHRVLGCDGSGELSSVIAAIDAVTRDAQRPAVINMSFGGTASDAMDAAVRASIADGVTNVVAAGNDAADARESSPGRVAEAITVGATDASDFRAVFSNFGPGLDLFAPGVGIDSAWFSTDTAVRRLSGTSMAAPHVTGVVALYLEQNPTGTPAQARGALLSAATPNVISSPGAGSANLLLFAGTSETAYVSVQSPNGGERTFAGSPYLVTWFASGVSFTGFDVEFSADGGATFTLAAPCVGLAGNERSCVWTPPANTTTKGLIRVTGRHAAGAGQDRSNAFFNVRSDIPSVKVSVPTTAISWAHGTSQEIKWSHNLGANSFVRVELSRDGGGTFPEVLNESLKNASSSAGSYLWKVTGRNTANAMVRVSWTHGAAADASAVPFTITDPSLTMSSPSSTSTNWGFGTRQRVKWSTNLGKFATVQVLLSTDGGATYPTVLATKSASTQFADVTAPVLAAATGSARVRVIWVDGPAGSPLAALSPTFTIAPPFVRVTTPNGGQTWTAGTNAAVKWVSNLGALESLRMDLSTDGGASWPIVVVPGTASDGSHTLNVSGGWVGSTAKARLVWLKNAAITDASDAVFVIR